MAISYWSFAGVDPDTAITEGTFTGGYYSGQVLSDAAGGALDGALRILRTQTAPILRAAAWCYDIPAAAIDGASTPMPRVTRSGKKRRGRRPPKR